MNKPAFDPSKPYRVVKPSFDPSLPFEVVGKDSERPIMQQQSEALGKVIDNPEYSPFTKGLAIAGHGSKAMGKYAGKVIDPVASWIIEGVKKSIERYDIQKPISSDPINKAIVSATKGYKSFTEKYPETTENIGNMLAIASVLPIGKIGGLAKKSIEPTLKATGEALESGGKKYLQSQLKITKPTAQKAYGKTLTEKKDNIVNDIVAFDLHKSKDFSEMGKKAKEMVSDLQKQSEELAEKIRYDQEVARKIKLSNPSQMVRNAEKDILESAAYGDGEKVKKIVKSILDDMKKDGMNHPVAIDKLIKAKRKIIGDSKIYSKGAGITADDQVNAQIRKDIVSRFLDKVEQFSPEMREIGRKQKKLLDISHVADDAASRLSNRDPIGLASRIILGGSVPASATALATGNPKAAAAIMAGGVGQYALEKSLQQGAGPRKLIGAGKLIQKIAEPSKEVGRFKLPQFEMLKNQRGSVDLYSASFGLKPAIKSPLSGKIYKGDIGESWFGHKQISGKISRTEPEAETSIMHELLKDNTGEYSPYVGFVDKDGNFISRIEAEKALAKKQTGSLVSQFHDESGKSKISPILPIAGALSGAGWLSLAEIERRKHLGNMKIKSKSEPKNIGNMKKKEK